MKHSTFQKFFLSIFLFVFSFSSFAQCNYSIELYDSYGDGWNNGIVTVLVNGTAVLTDLTIANGNGPESHNFTVNTGDDITTSYTPGQFSQENEYKIRDGLGNILVEEGIGNVTPGNITTGTITAFCPTCPAPINLFANNIDATSADLIWEETGAATNWNLEWGIQGFTLGSGTAVNSLTATNHHLTGLSTGNVYSFYVQADCGTDQSLWMGPFSFSDLPGCNYTISLYDSYGDGWQTGIVSVFVNGTAVLTDITLASGGGPENHTFPVSIGSDVTTEYTPGSYASENQYKILDSDGIVIADQGAGNNTPGNITTGTIIANCSSCPAPLNLDANNVDENSADLSWQENGTATIWNLEWGTQGFTLGTGTAVNNLSVTNYSLSGLSQSITYEFYVQSDCGTEQSSWVGPYSFTTTVLPVSNPSVCGVNYQIPDGAPDCLNAPILVSGIVGNTIGVDIMLRSVNLIIDHTYDSDLRISLISPSGISIDLSSNNGGGDNNYGINDGTCLNYTSFRPQGIDGNITDGQAPFVGNYNPEESFDSFLGESPNGTWVIQICDGMQMDIGLLQFVELSFGPIFDPSNLIINEIDVDQISDTLEFIELYDGGLGYVPLDGYTVAFYNGSSNQIYNIFDLDGYTTDANGYFVLGNAAVPSVDLTFANGNLQDGADAVALYTDDATNLPIGTLVTTNNLMDALVYGTGDATDADLMPLLNLMQTQFDEDELGNKKQHSCSRLPNGTGGLRNTDTYSAAMPTPGAENMGVPELIYVETEFTEALANDGSIENSISLQLENNDFVSLGLLSEATDYTATNIPTGLSLEIEILTGTTAELRLTGNAASHIQSDDISNLNITFTDAAYNTYASSLVVNNSTDLLVNFFDAPPATMIWIGDTLFEDAVADDGSINTSITVELISETFTVPTGSIYDFTSANVPAGLFVDIQATDNAHATITLTGNADSHLAIDDINNLEIIFTDEAFSGGSSIAVNGYSKSDITVDFYEFFNNETDILTYSFMEQTGPAAIDAVNHTIDIEVENGTNVFSLISTFTLSTDATVFVTSNEQISGTSPNNFGLPVTYNVVAEDGVTSQNWIITVDISTKVSEISEEIQISIYPNPASKQLTIDNGQLIIKNIQIFDISGKIVKQIKVNKSKTNIDIENLTDGMYWIKITTDKKTINKNLIIE